MDIQDLGYCDVISETQSDRVLVWLDGGWTATYADADTDDGVASATAAAIAAGSYASTRTSTRATVREGRRYRHSAALGTAYAISYSKTDGVDYSSSIEYSRHLS